MADVFQNIMSIEEFKLSIKPVANWEQAILNPLIYWFFQFQNSHMDHLRDPKRSFSLFSKSCRPQMLDWPMQHIKQLVGQCNVWKVDLFTEEFYECSWEDFLFHSPTISYWLHFGVSD